MFFGQVLCSTVGVVQRHRFSLVRREPRLCSRDDDERHHRPVTASAPDRSTTRSPTHQARRASQPINTRQMFNGETSGAGNGVEGGGGSLCAGDGGPAPVAAPAGGRGAKRRRRRTGFGQGGQSIGSARTGSGAHVDESPRPSKKAVTSECSTSVLKRTTPPHSVLISEASAPERAWPKVSALPTTSAKAATKPAAANLGVRHASIQHRASHEAARH